VKKSVFLFLLAAGVASATADHNIALQRLAASRIRRIEKLVGVSFDGGNPDIRAVPMVDWYYAQYEPNTAAILVNAKDVSFEGNRVSVSQHFKASSISKSLEGTLDHELGHMLTDQLSRRIGNGAWPPSQDKMVRMSWAEVVGIKTTSEGIATWIGLGGKCPEGASAASLASIQSVEALYAGGCWMVGDILAGYHERGLRYLITHPFMPERSDALPAAAADYRAKATDALARN
jgi:hypothetical protein